MDADVNSCKPTCYEIIAWITTGIILIAILKLNLLTVLISGFLVYELVHSISSILNIPRLTEYRAKIVAISILSFLVVVFLLLCIWGTIAFFNSDLGSLPALLNKMAEILESAQAKLPSGLVSFLPEDIDEFNDAVVGWLNTNAKEISIIGIEFGQFAVYMLIGMILGGMISLTDITPANECLPLMCAFLKRIAYFHKAFRSVVFAQVRISALNTALTAIYLLILLPLFGVKLPLVYALVVITFIAGMMPVIGNLISNSIIVIISLSYSFYVALASLAFLVIIHKLEYFLDAKILGTQIKAHAWEILIAMLVMEAAFGIGGVIAAPIYYAYVKSELVDQELI